MPSVQKDGTHWLKRVLIPLWLIRLGLIGIIIVLSIVGIVVSAKRVSDNDDGFLPGEEEGQGIWINWKAALATYVVLFCVLASVFLMDILSIIKFLRHSLTPKSLVITSSIQSVVAIAIVGLEIWDSTRGAGAGGVVGAVFIAATFLIMLVYAIITMRKQKRSGGRGTYQPANPTQPQGWQQQGWVAGNNQQTPFKTGAYEPYGGVATGYTGATELQQQAPPTQGAAADYYAPGFTSKPSIPELNHPVVQPRQQV